MKYSGLKEDEPCCGYFDRNSVTRSLIWSDLKKYKWLRIQSGKLGPGPPHSLLSPMLSKLQSITGLRLLLSKAPPNSEVFYCFKESPSGYQ